MRAFVAIDVPKDLMRFAMEFKEDGVRILDEFHLTLKFYEEISQKEIDRLIVKLCEISVPQFHLHLTGLGVFPSEKRINVAWAGLEDEGFLCEIRKAVDRACERGGKKFVPHVTFARIKFLKDKEGFLRKIKETQTRGTFEVKNFKLYESILKPEGAEYRVIKSFKLK